LPYLLSAGLRKHFKKKLAPIVQVSHHDAHAAVFFVSPFEVEAALLSHPDVLEAAVVGIPDESELIKPKAYVVTKPGVQGSPTLADALKQHVKDRLAPYKYPRWIEFLPELPKTSTGKIQRYRLRQTAP